MCCMCCIAPSAVGTMRVRCMAVAYSHTANYIAFLYSARYIIPVDLVLTNGKRMVKALPMALPGDPQGCRTLEDPWL